MHISDDQGYLKPQEQVPQQLYNFYPRVEESKTPDSASSLTPRKDYSEMFEERQKASSKQDSSAKKSERGAQSSGARRLILSLEETLLT